MSAIIDAAVATQKEKVREARWYRRNACARHGVMFDDDTPETKVTVQHEHTHVNEPVPTQPTKPTEPQQPTTPDGGKTPTWVKWAAGLGIPALTALGGLTGYLLGDKEDKPQPQQPVVIEQPPPEGYNSTIQWLEDHGRHLPNAK